MRVLAAVAFFYDEYSPRYGTSKSSVATSTEQSSIVYHEHLYVVDHDDIYILIPQQVMRQSLHVVDYVQD
jgi:hypothetical protein